MKAKVFVRLMVEHYTEEGMELHEIDPDKAKGMTTWLETLVDPYEIERFGPITGKPDRTNVFMRSGDEFVAKGSMGKVLDYINDQIVNTEKVIADTSGFDDNDNGLLNIAPAL